MPKNPEPKEFSLGAASRRAPGTPVHSSDQGPLSTCSSHALAKAVQDKLDASKIDVDQEHVQGKLQNLHPLDPTTGRPIPRGLSEFDKKEIEIDVSEEGHVLKKTIKFNISEFMTGNSHWTDTTKLEAPKDFLAVGCLDLNPPSFGLTNKNNKPQACHAIYIKSYDPDTRKVKTINSHGGGGELGLNKDGIVLDTAFYSVANVQLTFG